MKNTLKRYWPTVLTLGAGLATFLTPSIQAFAGSHATYSVAVLTVWGVVLHNLSAPKDS